MEQHGKVAGRKNLKMMARSRIVVIRPLGMQKVLKENGQQWHFSFSNLIDYSLNSK